MLNSEWTIVYVHPGSGLYDEINFLEVRSLKVQMIIWCFGACTASYEKYTYAATKVARVYILLVFGVDRLLLQPRNH